jgi:hypothetical protein
MAAIEMSMLTSILPIVVVRVSNLLAIQVMIQVKIQMVIWGT